jgi:hypothetical protein
VDLIRTEAIFKNKSKNGIQKSCRICQARLADMLSEGNSSNIPVSVLLIASFKGSQDFSGIGFDFTKTTF